ncbi:MAG: universal stress protein [Syntrophobacteraceae bacterium]
MEKKLLITVSDEISHLHGVRFVGSFFRNKAAVNVTLFYVAPHASIAGTDRPRPVELDRKAAETCRAKAQHALDASRQILCDSGFASQNVNTKFILRQFGTVKDIIREAKSGQYDAVILGRRGYMIFESAFATSVTRQILDMEIDFPLWVCRRPEENRRNVLLCIDGSESSLRMVDHAGFMLGDENEHSVTLLHVDTGEGENVEAIMNKARKTLLDNWVSDGRVTSLVVARGITEVAKAILEETQAKGYAAVGVGRTGMKKGLLKEWLLGSRTMKLVESIEKAALWVSR